jgi:hypothetical protein
MRDYFKTEDVVQFYVISKDRISSYLKKEVLREIYKLKIESATKKVDISDILQEIWENINRSLE